MSLSITPRLILEAARKRGWGTTVLSEKYALYKLRTPSGKEYYLHNITTVKSGAVNSFIAEKKDLLHLLVSGLGVPTPATLLVSDDVQAAQAFLAEHGRIVVKPSDQAHGKGITLNVVTPQQLAEALDYAREHSRTTLLQEQIAGNDYRLLFIGGKLAAAAIRKPAYVVGDGKRTIAELVKIENESDRRGVGYQKLFTNIDAHAAERYLGGRLSEIPAAGAEVQVIGVANIGRGGVAIDVTDIVDPNLVHYAQLVVDHFAIGLCGVDFIVTAKGDPYLIELNTAPSLGLHEAPAEGKPRHTPDAFLDWLAAP